jgi:hypothetical protein
MTRTCDRQCILGSARGHTGGERAEIDLPYSTQYALYDEPSTKYVAKPNLRSTKPSVLLGRGGSKYCRLTYTIDSDRFRVYMHS